ncbi:MAG: hypothetical protein WC768_03295 [Patescibacteria group bacterium]|jgi:hypothetical protein
MQVKAIAFIPEVNFETRFKKPISLGSSGLFLISNTDARSINLKNELVKYHYKIKDGIYLFFDGSLRQDGTLYEVFQSFALALTFYYEGSATCRVYQEIIKGGDADLELFIDEYDQFRYDKDDNRILRRLDLKTITSMYEKIWLQLSNKNFNPLKNSLDFFQLYSKESLIKARLLYLNICLEGLFFDGSEKDGISYKLGLRCASLLHDDDKSIDLLSTYNEVKTGYDLRSTIIHGGNYNKVSARVIKGQRTKASSETDHIEILVKILKRTYKVIFKNNDLYIAVQKNQLGGKIDKGLILHN